MQIGADAIDRAIELHKSGQAESAREAYQEILQQEPNNADALRLLGVMRLQEGDALAAEQCIRQALHVAPDNAKAHDNLGMLLHLTNRHAEAAAAFEEAIRLDPELTAAHANLGKLRLLAGDKEAARVCFQNLVNLDPDDRAARYYLTRILLETGEPHAALDTVDGLLAQHPGDAQGLAFKAIALLEVGDGEAERRLMDLDGLVTVTTLACPEGFADLDSFNGDLAAFVNSHPSLAQNAELQNGLATQELGNSDRPALQLLLEAFQAEAARRRADLPTGSDHPFAAHAPGGVTVQARGIKLWQDGAQAPRVGHGAWLSGIYVAQAPGDQSTAAGSIELGRARASLYNDGQARVRGIAPAAGTLITFPAFMWQAVQPVAGEGEQILLRLDAVAEE